MKPVIVVGGIQQKDFTEIEACGGVICNSKIVRVEVNTKKEVQKVLTNLGYEMK